MKKLTVIVFTVLVSVMSAYAQHNLRSAYFLDGYTYKHKLNPAFGGERGYFAIPALGHLSLGVESTIPVNNIFYKSGGQLTTFLDPGISSSAVMKNIKDNNPLVFNTDISLISFGFNVKNSYSTIDLSLKTDGRAIVPSSVFSWVKGSASNIDMSNLRCNADARLELSYGYSQEIKGWLRVGGKVKFLAGLAKAEYIPEKLKLQQNGDSWMVESAGQGYFLLPGSQLVLEGTENRIDDITMNPFKDVLNAMLSTRSLGAALDLGISMDLAKDYITISAALTDLGVISWNGLNYIGCPSGTHEYQNFVIDQEMTVSEQLSEFGEGLVDLAALQVNSTDAKLIDMIGMTAHLGIELRMPFWKRLSVGLLGTARIDGKYSWYEGRASANLALFRCLSLTANYAYSTFGQNYGAALNFHPKGINLFVGIDSFAPLLDKNSTLPKYMMATNAVFGLDIAFGKYTGRYTKKVKEAK